MKGKNRLILSLLLIMALQLVLNLKQLKLKHLLNVKLAYKEVCRRAEKIEKRSESDLIQKDKIMSILVIADHNNQTLNGATLNVVAAAQKSVVILLY